MTNGQILKQHRLNLGMTRDQLAAKSGIKASAIERMEQDITDPTVFRGAFLKAGIDLFSFPIKMEKVSRMHWIGLGSCGRPVELCVIKKAKKITVSMYAGDMEESVDLFRAAFNKAMEEISK